MLVVASILLVLLAQGLRVVLVYLTLRHLLDIAQRQAALASSGALHSNVLDVRNSLVLDDVVLRVLYPVDIAM